MDLGRYIETDDGQVVQEPNLTAWSMWMERANRIVARTEIDDILISTVFLGIDHAWGGGPPVLWETMVFGGPLDDYTARYTNRAAALANHHQMVMAVRYSLEKTRDDRSFNPVSWFWRMWKGVKSWIDGTG